MTPSNPDAVEAGEPVLGDRRIGRRRGQVQRERAAPSAPSSASRRADSGSGREVQVVEREQVEGHEVRRRLDGQAAERATRRGGSADRGGRSRARPRWAPPARRRGRSALGQLLAQRVEQFGEVPGERATVAAAELDLVAVAEHDAAVPVPLRFVEQVARGELRAALASIGLTGGITGSCTSRPYRRDRSASPNGSANPPSSRSTSRAGSSSTRSRACAVGRVSPISTEWSRNASRWS